jgi:hypothetical protein
VGGVYDVSPRYRGRQFRDIPQICAVHLERARERAPLRTRLPPALYAAHDRKLIEIFYWHRTVLRTTARRDFSRAQVVCINSKTRRKGGGSPGDVAVGFLMKKRQNGRLNVIF